MPDLSINFRVADTNLPGTHLIDRVLLARREDATQFGEHPLVGQGTDSDQFWDESLCNTTLAPVRVSQPRSLAFVQQPQLEIFPSATELHSIRQMIEDLESLDATLRASNAGVACRKFVTGLGRRFANQVDTRCAVFGEEDGTVTLLAHSRALSRQLSLEFGTDGTTVGLVKIDEFMRRYERRTLLSDLNTLQKAIAWLGSC